MKPEDVQIGLKVRYADVDGTEYIGNIVAKDNERCPLVEWIDNQVQETVLCWMLQPTE